MRISRSEGMEVYGNLQEAMNGEAGGDQSPNARV
jgi:hypothetical protein